MMQQPTNRNLPAAPDETGYRMPQEAETWVYGEPARQMEEGGPAGVQAAIPGMNGTAPSTGPSSSAAYSARMKNPVDMGRTHTPSGADDAYHASLRSLLDRNVGYFVVATFLVGPDRPVTWRGILHTVGSDYVVLYQPDYERYISGDLYALKFVQFYNVRGVPYAAASENWEGHTSF